MLAQILGGLHPEHLEQRVLDDAHGETRGDVRHVGAVFLSLLDGAVHEHRTAAAQIHGVAGEQTELREIRDRIAQRSRKGLDKAAAAGAAGFVQDDGIDGVVADGQAFHVLAADIHDEIHVGVEEPGCAVVRHGLHETAVQMECPLDEFLAVAGNGGAGDGEPRIGLFIDDAQMFAHHVHRVALVVAVVRIQDGAFRIDEDEFRRRAAAVDAQVSLAGISFQVSGRHLRAAVPFEECRIFRLVFEQRFGMFGLDGGACSVLQSGQPLFIGITGFLTRAVERSAQRYGKTAVFREHGVFIRQF